MEFIKENYKDLVEVEKEAKRVFREEGQEAFMKYMLEQLKKDFVQDYFLLAYRAMGKTPLLVAMVQDAMFGINEDYWKLLLNREKQNNE